MPVLGLSMAIAVAIHTVIAFVLLRLDGATSNREDDPVQIEVAEPPSPPPQPRPEPVEPPAPPTPPRVVTRRVAPEPPSAKQPTSTPPPPNQTPPPNAPTNAPPVFGVTMSSVVSGEAAVAVPVGNTTMTKPGTSPPTDSPKPYAASGAPGFVPESEINIASPARVLHEVNSDDYYPPDARTLGIEGSVRLSVDIDEHGKVVGARVIRRAGHGFDEKALQAMKQFRFSPARAPDGRPVRCRIAYDYTFSLNN